MATVGVKGLNYEQTDHKRDHWT